MAGVGGRLAPVGDLAVVCESTGGGRAFQAVMAVTRTAAARTPWKDLIGATGFESMMVISYEV